MIEKEQRMTRTTTKTKTTSTARIIVILAMLAAFAPLATDMYLPGFHLMMEYFNGPEGSIETTLSVFFLGLAIGQAFYGPLIDRFGRRVPLLLGIGLFLIATGICLFTSDLYVFTTFRFIQAVGGCSGMIVGRAIISDLFDTRENARAQSLLIMILTVAPVFAPILGGFIIAHAGWKTIFIFILVFGLLCGGLAWFFVPETLPPEKRRVERLSQIFRTWLLLITNPKFILPALVGGLAQACMFAFITGSPFVLINLHGTSPQTYSLLFALIACALIVSAQLNRIALQKKSPEFLLSAALIVNVIAGLGTVLSVSLDSLVALLVPLWFTIGTLGFIGANAAAIAMVASGKYIGSGSSLLGILQFACAALVSSLIATAQNGTAYPMTLTIAGCGTGAAIIWLGVRKEGYSINEVSRKKWTFKVPFH